MSIEITFVRHGQTEANAASIWQGQGDAALSSVGRDQSRALGARLAAKEFDLVVSSDLTRTLQTCELAGLQPVVDSAWREMDVGAWEGMSRTEVLEAFPDEIRRLRSGDLDVEMGGGESWGRFSSRVDEALAKLCAGAPAGSRVLVMTHGGVIHAALSGMLGFRGRRPSPVSRMLNAAVTEVVVSDEGSHLQVLNDAGHVPVVTGNEGLRGATVALVRHGESEANVAGRWHGRTDGPLSEAGVEQANALAAAYDGIAFVYSSPLERARRTATIFAGAHDLGVEVEPALAEIDFGSWEGMTPSEIGEADPAYWKAVFADGLDLPRGGTGETFTHAGERMEAVVRAAVKRHPESRVAMFGHGGAIWSLAARILGIEWARWRSLALPGNTHLSHVRVTDGRQVLVDYNVAAR